ncbi:MAG TPA: HAD family hydrolase [Tepidisphaeraceae bacterium]|jgi:FMN phosphatase YigB (HAD superfamily)
MSQTPVVFLFDVDNTLLDNDRVTTDIAEFLDQHFGGKARQEYFAIFETLRSELGYADYLGALQRYRIAHPEDVRVLNLSQFLIDYPFRDRLYPGAIEVLREARAAHPTAILSDGDVVFQPRKIRQAGIHVAVEGHVMIYIHKELELADVQRRYPAEHYIFVDDKPRLIRAIKQQWGSRVTAVWPRQGHYAAEISTGTLPEADMTINHIADLSGKISQLACKS